MKFKIEGREYEFDGTLKVKEAMVLQDRAGCGLNEADAALHRGNPYAIAAWMFILKQRAKEVVRWEDMLELDARTFVIVPDEPTGEKPDGDTDQRVPPDPTQLDGTTPEDATTNT